MSLRIIGRILMILFAVVGLVVAYKLGASGPCTPAVEQVVTHDVAVKTDMEHKPVAVLEEPIILQEEPVQQEEEIVHLPSEPAVEIEYALEPVVCETLNGIMQIRDPVLAAPAFCRFLRNLSAETIKTAYADIMALPEDFEKRELYRREVLARWAQLDALGALVYLKSHPWDNHQDKFDKSFVISTWASADLESAMNYAESVMTDQNDASLMNMLLQLSVDKDLEKVTDRFYQLPPGKRQNDTLDCITKAYLARGVDAAVRWLKEIPDSGLAERAVSTIATQLVLTDSSEADHWFESLGDETLQESVMPGLIAGKLQKYRGEVKEIGEWIASLSSADLKTKAYDTLVEECLAMFPSDYSAKWSSGKIIADLKEAGVDMSVPEFRKAQARLNWALTKHETQDFTRWDTKIVLPPADWIETLPSNRLEARDYYAMVKDFVNRKKYSDAVDWLNEHPASSQKDPAVEELATRLAIKDPEMALRLAESLSDTGHREALIKFIESQKKKAE